MTNATEFKTASHIETDFADGLRAWFDVVQKGGGETETAVYGLHEDGDLLDCEGHPVSHERYASALRNVIDEAIEAAGGVQAVFVQ